MIMEMLLVLMSLGNGTHDNSISGCDYYGGGNLRLDCLDNYYCKNYYGGGESSAQDLLLRSGCDSDSDCPIIDGLGRGQDLVYRQYCDRLLEPEREWNDNDDDEFVPDQ